MLKCERTKKEKGLAISLVIQSLRLPIPRKYKLNFFK